MASTMRSRPASICVPAPATEPPETTRLPPALKAVTWPLLAVVPELACRVSAPVAATVMFCPACTLEPAPTVTVCPCRCTCPAPLTAAAPGLLMVRAPLAMTAVCCCPRISPPLMCNAAALSENSSPVSKWTFLPLTELDSKSKPLPPINTASPSFEFTVPAKAASWPSAEIRTSPSAEICVPLFRSTC